MAMPIHVELEGREEIRRALLRLERHAISGAIAATKASAEELEREARSRVPVKTGVTRDSVRTIYRDGGLSASVGSAYMVARYLEHGTRKMAARRWLAPAWEIVRPRYLDRLREALGRAATKAAP